MHLTDLQDIYDSPFFDLISRAREVYLANWTGNEVQLCTLLSIKTGGCSEDCAYCAQSARYDTGVKAERLMPVEEVMAVAQAGAGERVDPVLHGGGVEGGAGGGFAVRAGPGDGAGVSELGMEVCVTLGQLSIRRGAAAQGGGGDGVQSQYRHIAGVLPGDRFDAHISGPAGYDRGRARPPACRCAAAGSSGWARRNGTGCGCSRC